MKRIGVVAAVHGALAPARNSFQSLWPGAQTVDLYDEYLYFLYHRENRVTPEMYERVRDLLTLSARSGVDGIVFTGSLWTECVKACRDDFEVPVLAAYDSLIEKVLDTGASRMALIAAEPGTITSFEKDFKAAANDTVELEAVYVDHAMDVLAAGDRAKHDQIVIDAANQLTTHDVLLLAQFSMESVAEQLRQSTGKTVYGSLGAAADKLKQLLD